MDRHLIARAPRQLATPRLVLQWPRPEHAEAVMRSINASLPDLGFIAWGREVVDSVWADAFTRTGAGLVAEGSALIYYAFERGVDDEPGELVGNLDLHSFDFAVPRCEIGYVADSRHAGRGLMREAALALVDLAFRLGFVRVEAFSDVRNLRALRFAEAIGFVREGVLRARTRDLDGELCDEALYARLAPPAATWLR